MLHLITPKNLKDIERWVDASLLQLIGKMHISLCFAIVCVLESIIFTYSQTLFCHSPSCTLTLLFRSFGKGRAVLMLCLIQIDVDSPNREIFRQLSSHIRSNIYLSQLRVSGLTGTEAAEYIAKAVAAAIRVSASLTSINLRGNYIGAECAKHIADGIAVSASLTSINLAKNKIGSEGAKHIAKGIAVSASLTQVLAFCKLFCSLSHSLTAVVLLLTQINLGANNIGGCDDVFFRNDGNIFYTPEGSRAIADALRVSASLTKVPAFCK